MAAKNPASIAGVPELVVLGILANREIYGYDVARAVKIATNDALKVISNN